MKLPEELLISKMHEEHPWGIKETVKNLYVDLGGNAVFALTFLFYFVYSNE